MWFITCLYIGIRLMPILSSPGSIDIVCFSKEGSYSYMFIYSSTLYFLWFDFLWVNSKNLNFTIVFPHKYKKRNNVILISFLQALNLTCNISGNPAPEVTWLKNDREMVSDDHFVLKFESGKFASFTITSVNTSDSGKYSILVKNKYGTESGDFTVSVFIPDEMPVKKK